ncbi:hypothetical protein SIN8267_00823 [Sinobacterium norvegicum]|uniref:Uncharacterized protein n=1 Tax=Sinobacterium norvegicum TaxID=1641715 RepID=A0ABN8EGG2_9GAMM|nr:hypothetical protein [Sinobacterium norvegicum]CAH0990728.1 hypothetical protein SIN8267_00823 [Sinobacterium norvegicum]
MTLATNWVFKPNAMHLLQQLRKRVKAEFGFTLRFKDDELAEQLTRVKNTTVDEKTVAIVADIEEMRGVSFDQEELAKTGTYRGQSVVKQSKQELGALSISERTGQLSESLPQRRQKMYRGRPVVS